MPGQFVTADEGAKEAQREKYGIFMQTVELGFAEEIKFLQDRLQQEKALLKKMRQAG